MTKRNGQQIYNRRIFAIGTPCKTIALKFDDRKINDHDDVPKEKGVSDQDDDRDYATHLKTKIFTVNFKHEIQL